MQPKLIELTIGQNYLQPPFDETFFDECFSSYKKEIERYKLKHNNDNHENDDDDNLDNDTYTFGADIYANEDYKMSINQDDFPNSLEEINFTYDGPFCVNVKTGKIKNKSWQTLHFSWHDD